METCVIKMKFEKRSRDWFLQAKFLHQIYAAWLKRYNDLGEAKYLRSVLGHIAIGNTNREIYDRLKFSNFQKKLNILFKLYRKFLIEGLEIYVVYNAPVPIEAVSIQPKTRSKSSLVWIV